MSESNLIKIMTEENKKRQENETIKDWLKRTSIKDDSWLKKAKHRQMKRPIVTDFTETIYRADAYKYTQEQEKYIDYLEAQAEQLILSGVSQQRKLLNALANDFNDSTDTYVGEKTIEKILKAFNCG